MSTCTLETHQTVKQALCLQHQALTVDLQSTTIVRAQPHAGRWLQSIIVRAQPHAGRWLQNHTWANTLCTGVGQPQPFVHHKLRLLVRVMTSFAPHPHPLT
jgi:hypothetical protein